MLLCFKVLLAGLAQLVERKALNLVVVGSSPRPALLPPTAAQGAPLVWRLSLK